MYGGYVGESGIRVDIGASLWHGEREARGLEHARTNRHPSELAGQQRRAIGAAGAPRVFDDCAQKRENARIVEPAGSQLAARVAYGIAELTARHASSAA